MANSFINLGRVYERLNLNRLSLVQYKKSLIIGVKVNNTYIRAIANLSISNIYNALNYPDSARFFLIQSQRLGENLSNNSLKAIINHDLALSLFEADSMRKALDYVMKAIPTFDKEGDKFSLALSYILLGSIYRKENQTIKAEEHLRKGLELAKEINAPILKINSLKNLSELFFKQDTDSSLKYLIKATGIEDTLNQLQKQAIEFERIHLNTLAQNELLESKNQLLEEKDQRKTQLNYSLIIGCILILLVLISLFLGYRQRKKTQFSQKNEQLALQKIEGLISGQELKLTKARLEVQDQERKRIAKDLHDEVGSLLSIAQLNFQTIEDKVQLHFQYIEDILINMELKNSELFEKTKELYQANEQQYQKANGLLNKVYYTVRNLSHQIGDNLLANLGLIPAIQDLINTINESQLIKAEFYSFDLDERLPENIEVHLYKVIQELLTNTLKHAEASEVTLQLVNNSKFLNITLEDNGQGFNPEKTPTSETGMGIRNIRSRVLDLKGSLQIDSGKGSGTTIIIDIPL